MSAKLRRFNHPVEFAAAFECYLCSLKNWLMIKSFLTIFSVFIASALSAQWCGTPQEPILERTDANKLAMVPTQRGAIKYIPVTFHMVANSAGNGRISVENILYQVANINAAYADQEAIFYIDRLNSFNNDAVYSNPRTAAGFTQMDLREDNNSVNVFCVNNIEAIGPGQTLAYYDPQGDWIVSRKGEINLASSTLSHEVGHFFSLAHPFNGWDCVPYTLDDYTNPVNVDFTLPCEGGGGSVLIELHNRSNCNTAGDHICDTPEDYNLGLFYQNDCDENNSIMDKNGEVIKPMTNNFMSYYSECPTYAFTQTQKNLVNTDFNSAQRSYIRTGNIPNTTPVTQPVQYITPINGQETNGTSNILLDWADTPGANKYLVKYDRFSSFTFAPVDTIVSTSQLVITGPLTENVTYYWKVWPYNESQTGAGYSATQNFRSAMGTGVNEISDITDYTLSPNPVADHTPAALTVSSNASFSAVLEVTNASGQALMSEKITVPTGISRHELATEELPAGIYFVALHSSSGRLVERLFIME
jgi:hypothetical protein